MHKRRLPAAWGTALLCLALWLGVSGSCLAEDSDALWTTALEALKAKKGKEAAEALDAWTEQARARGIHSREAHWNLGLAHWQAKHPGASLHHFLSSARLSSWPWEGASVLTVLTSLEHEIGIRDGLTRDLPFQLRLLVPQNTVWLLGALSFWCLVPALLFWMKSSLSAALSFASLGLALGLVGGMGYALEKYSAPLATLESEAEGIALYRSPTDKPEQKLASLPAGTLVEYGSRKEDFVQVLRPVGGWIAAASLRPVTFPP